MKKAIWMMMVVLLVAGAVWAKDFTLTKKAGDLTVDVKIDKNPPVVGNNNMVVGLKDASGKDVTDAKVSVDYGMPAMPGMPAMNYKANAMLHGNMYHTVMNLSMSGSWNVTVKINRQGKTVSTKFSIDAR
ncbi:MAG: FixH family protein [Deltaproteobacteria bacterium]|nr:FixH family protein [Deltaproteobacteria bacterium]